MEKIFKVADIHNWLKKVTTGKISYSRMVELMNLKAQVNTNSNEQVNKLLSLLDVAKGYMQGNECKRWQDQYNEAMRDYWDCESCGNHFAGDIAACDDNDNAFCDECYTELAPVMKAEYEELKRKGEL